MSKQVIKVLIDELIYDPENANKMPEGEFKQLVSNIKAVGEMLQPILVKEVPEGFQVVDGEHRARASKEAGLDRVLAVVWDGSEAMRKALALSFNKLRGELDLSKVQRIVAKLHEEGWSVGEIRMTGFNEDEINDLLAVNTDLDPDAVMENPIAAPQEDDDGDDDKPKIFQIELLFATADEMKFVKRGLRKAAGKGREMGEGLLKLLGYEPKGD